MIPSDKVVIALVLTSDGAARIDALSVSMSTPEKVLTREEMIAAAVAAGVEALERRGDQAGKAVKP